ncbi:hypothetical protein [Bacillus sp. Marseille-P3800]|uniref:hypothetical protein n=1 Tax=Bacillus sp. Marseille-P3800 TaxID=2014782 RepID=UPI00159B9A06|nr:hypothetical protein [Bacillus sp. Marseille-P3800]
MSDHNEGFEIKTSREKIAYFLGYVQAHAENHAEEYKRDVEEVKKMFLDDLTVLLSAKK